MDARGCTWRSRGVRGVSCWGVCEGSRVRGIVSWGVSWDWVVVPGKCRVVESGGRNCLVRVMSRGVPVSGVSWCGVRVGMWV